MFQNIKKDSILFYLLKVSDQARMFPDILETSMFLNSAQLIGNRLKDHRTIVHLPLT